jgi:hypothetical protein
MEGLEISMLVAVVISDGIVKLVNSQAKEATAMMNLFHHVHHTRFKKQARIVTTECKLVSQI